MQVNTVKLGANATNCYILHNSEEGIIIDPGSASEFEDIWDVMDPDKYNYKYIINTHAHFDHIGANSKLKQKLEISIAVHEEEAEALEDPKLNSSLLLGKDITSPSADITLSDGDEIKFGSGILSIYHTPGHSPGGIVIYSPQEKILFSGDTIFRGGVGRTDLPGGDSLQLENSLQRIKKLFPSEVKVYPGHGEPTDLAEFFESVFPRIY